MHFLTSNSRYICLNDSHSQTVFRSTVSSVLPSHRKCVPCCCTNATLVGGRPTNPGICCRSCRSPSPDGGPPTMVSVFFFQNFLKVFGSVTSAEPNRFITAPQRSICRANGLAIMAKSSAQSALKATGSSGGRPRLPLPRQAAIRPLPPCSPALAG